MEKDINVLLETTCIDIFEEQATLWSGMEVFRNHAWKCVCGEPDCFMVCVQGFAEEFPDPQTFAIYLEMIRGIDSVDELNEFTKKFAQNPSKMRATNLN